MTKLAPEWVRTSDPVIRSPARYRWTTAPAVHPVVQACKLILGHVLPPYHWFVSDIKWWIYISTWGEQILVVIWELYHICVCRLWWPNTSYTIRATAIKIYVQKWENQQLVIYIYTLVTMWKKCIFPTGGGGGDSIIITQKHNVWQGKQGNTVALDLPPTGSEGSTSSPLDPRPHIYAPFLALFTLTKTPPPH